MFTVELSYEVKTNSKLPQMPGAARLSGKNNTPSRKQHESINRKQGYNASDNEGEAQAGRAIKMHILGHYNTQKEGRPGGLTQGKR